MTSIDRRTVLTWLSVAPLAGLLSGCKEEVPPYEGPDMVLPQAPALPIEPLQQEVRERALDAASKGLRWLIRKQKPDGSFRSRVYPVLASGQSLTPLILWTILELPSSLRADVSEQVDAAQQWILDAQEPSGALGFASRIEDYPSYATALALRCTLRLKPKRWSIAARKMALWLDEQQFMASRGWMGHPAEGGWGMGSEVALTPPQSGHVDLSMSRAALEALSDSGTRFGTRSESMSAANRFVLRAMVESGGFFSSPVLPRLNKGVAREDGHGPYGSATCDGLRALHALGYPRHHPVVQRSLQHLHSIHVNDRNPGIDPGLNRALAEGMKGYYRAGAATVFARLGGPAHWRKGIATAVLEEQQSVGPWLNKNRLLNEDDPLVATAFALQALSECLQVEERRK